MNYPYFPGCALYSKARSFDEAAKGAASKLGFSLEELPEWTCCGATFPLDEGNNMALLSPVRALANTRKAGGEKLVTLCAICHNVLKRANNVMVKNPARRKTVTEFLEEPYDGSVKVLHYLELLRDEIGFAALAEKVEKPLKGLKVAAYYGCLLLRPAADMAFDDPDRPTILEDLFAALGATPVDFPLKAECCGAFQVINSEATATRCSKEIVESAKSRGADLLVTACPLCQFNVEDRQNEMAKESLGFSGLPVLYFTELLGLALGAGQQSVDLKSHYVDPRPALERCGLWNDEAAGGKP